MYAQDGMSSWLVDKVVQSGRNRRGNTHSNASLGGRYNKVEMVDINSSQSYADDEEPIEGGIENTWGEWLENTSRLKQKSSAVCI